MTQNVYQPPRPHDEPAPPDRGFAASGARILLISFGASILLPQIIGFFGGLLGAASTGPGGSSPAGQLAATREILAFNGLVYPAALAAAPFGMWMLARGPRGGQKGPPRWLGLGAVLLATAAVTLASVRGIRRFLQRSMRSPSHELDFATTIAEALTLLAMALLVRHIATSFGAKSTRRLASATLAVVAAHLVLVPLLAVFDGGTWIVAGLLGLAKWILAFASLWSTRWLGRADTRPS